MLNRILKFINKQVDPYVLRVGDFSKAQQNWDFPPSAFLNSFILDWEKSRERTNDFSQVEFAKRIINSESNKHIWEESKLFKNEKNFDIYAIVEEEFKDGILGYSEQDLKNQIEIYRSRIEKSISEIDDLISSVQNKLNSLGKNEKGKILYLSAELDNLKQKSKPYKNNLDEAMLAKLSASYLMKGRGLSQTINYLVRSFRDIAIAPPFLKKVLLDLDLDNPFRHLVWISYPTYLKIQEEWEKNKDKKACLEILGDDFNIIEILNDHFNFGYLSNRKEILLESIQCTQNKCYTAASLLLYTQTEGILLDIAREINGKTFNSITINIFPNNTTNKYIDIDGNEKEFLSISNILFNSKMRYFLWPGFLEYFASDFYSQRCGYAHGQNLKSLDEYDYKTISMFTLTVLYIYQDLKIKGKAPSLSECYEKAIY